MSGLLFLITMVLLTLLLFFWVRRILKKDLQQERLGCARLRQESNKLLLEETRVKKEVLGLANTLSETIALYNITSEICKYLKPDKVFAAFREQLHRYLDIDTCKFIKPDSELSLSAAEKFLPIKIQDTFIGYLVIKGAGSEEEERLNIMTQQFALGLKRAFLYQRVQELAITDTLTQVFNRRHCLERLNEELERSKKFNYCLSFLMCDIDHFKEYNDHYGHLVGDVILREAAAVIKRVIRQVDFVGRYGGEEFLVLLTETEKSQASLIAERIRQAIKDEDIQADGENLHLTLSIGISAFPGDGDQIQMLIDRADSALYHAKQTGRNRACVYNPLH